MKLNVALAGNPNCGKTTLFNALTGSNQYVGNWPGVTVEKKEGACKKYPDITVTDLPGIYSLSPYTLEEVVARNFLVDERPDVILNIVDGTNLERNLYLTTQLAELGIPVVVAINMMDIVRKNGDKIDIDELSRLLGCTVIEMSALKNDNTDSAIDAAIKAAEAGAPGFKHYFSGRVEHALAHIEEATVHHLPLAQQRWYAVKIFERDAKVLETLGISSEVLAHIEQDIKSVEAELDDDADSIITNERYNLIVDMMRTCYKKKSAARRSISEKIDRVVTNRILAIPIFAVVMYLMYTISIGTVGDWTVGFMNDVLFGEWIVPSVTEWLTAIGCWDWLISLVADGIVGGVGAVLGFVPQMMILFVLLSILEDIGYMSRVAFIMDRIFRKFGLSGKSFIPMLIASGCGVPGIMASRTIDQERDRRMTIMTTGFIPCGAKMPIVGLIAGALFPENQGLVATGAYFIGIAAVVITGLMLKKTKPFAGEAAPFVMELPAYHAPSATNVLRATWERGWDFIKRAGTVIVIASISIWLFNSFSFEGGFHYITGDEASILNVIGSAIAIIFRPLGFGGWQAAVATILGLVAKEEVVGVFGSLSSMLSSDLAFELVEEGSSELAIIGKEFFGGSKLAGFSFMVFNLLCAPCFAAMGAIKREMNSPKWSIATIAYMTVFAYAVSLMVYQFGMAISGSINIVGFIAAVLVFAVMFYMLFIKKPYVAKAKK